MQNARSGVGLYRVTAIQMPNTFVQRVLRKKGGGATNRAHHCFIPTVSILLSRDKSVANTCDSGGSFPAVPLDPEALEFLQRSAEERGLDARLVGEELHLALARREALRVNTGVVFLELNNRHNT